MGGRAPDVNAKSFRSGWYPPPERISPVPGRSAFRSGYVSVAIEARTVEEHAVGKPYAQEMDRLAEIYAWVAATPLGTLPRAVRGAATLPLVAVGSGGSYT